jgi:hypothetical protein
LDGRKTFKQFVLTDAEFHGVGVSNHALEFSASRARQCVSGIRTFRRVFTACSHQTTILTVSQQHPFRSLEKIPSKVNT